MRPLFSLRILIVACGLPLIMTACSYGRVEPWQRDVLSRADMQFSIDDLSRSMNNQFYTSKEGSCGGAGFSGGGCGCN